MDVMLTNLKPNSALWPSDILQLILTELAWEILEQRIGHHFSTRDH